MLIDFQAADSEEETVKCVDIGLLFITEENSVEDMLRDYVDVAVILEEKIVIHELRDVPHAFAVLMGLLYSLNIDYPKGLKYTFKVTQKVFMDVGSANRSAEVHRLRNRILQCIF